MEKYSSYKDSGVKWLGRNIEPLGDYAFYKFPDYLTR